MSLHALFAIMGKVSIRILLTLLAAACYAPHPPAGAPCSSSGACPDGLVCSPATLTCELRAIDGGPADTSHGDAAVDARTDASPDAPVDAAPTVPVLVQEAATFASAGTSLSLTLPSAPIAGHVLVVIAGDPLSSLDSVSGGGATWTLAARSTAEANVEIWVGVTDGSSATVTISLAGNTAQLTLAVSEWANLAPTNLVDVTRTGTGSIGPASAGSITTTGAPELVLFGVAAFSSPTWGVPTGGPWTRMIGVSAGISQAAWYRVVTTPGTLAPIVTETGSSWDAALVALRGAP